MLWVQNESTRGNLGRPSYSQGWDSPSVVPESDDSRPLHRGPQHMEAVPSWKDWPHPKHVKGQARWIEKGPETVTALPSLGWFWGKSRYRWVWGLPDTLFSPWLLDILAVVGDIWLWLPCWVLSQGFYWSSPSGWFSECTAVWMTSSRPLYSPPVWKISRVSQEWWLVPVLRRQKQVTVCEFKASLIYRLTRST